MRVGLFVTCLVDQLWPTVGLATLEVLARAGCEVVYDPRQTCCGQPALNTGYADEARTVARRFLGLMQETLQKAEAVVMPSGSCRAWLGQMSKLFADEPEMLSRARRVQERTHELSMFLVHVLGVEDLDAEYDGRITWHDACHGLRDLGIRDEPRRLIGNVRGAQLVEMVAAEACCGFGGTFAVKYPEISVAILDRKLEEIESRNVGTVVSGDVSCLMQIQGRLQHRGSKVQTMHLAELLASRGSSS